ncbi:MAG: glycosyltransferase family 2 protein [Coraliomargaritaceae bacterium]
MDPKISVVAPVFNESEGIGEFIEAVARILNELGESWEFVLVNDGSSDSSQEIILKAQSRFPEITLVELSRNFGHQAAVTAAIDHAMGEAVIVMDADMQDPPEVIPQLIKAWENGGEVVFARRTARAETGLRRVGFELFHKCFRYVIDFPIPPNVGVFSLLDRAAVDYLKQLPERNRFLPGLYTWIGFRQDFVEYSRRDRSQGEPKQTFGNLFQYALDGVLSFSYKPIRLLGALGLCTAATAFFIAVFFAFKRLFGYEVAFTGFTTIVILISLLGGAILIGISLVGEYVARIYDEVKCRPAYIVRKVHQEESD